MVNDNQMAASKDSRWYMVRTKRGKEVWARSELERIASKVFLPLLGTGRPGEKPKPMFSQCLFAYLDIQRKCIDARYTQGIESIVFFGNELAEMSDVVVQRLKMVSVARTARKSMPESQAAIDRRLTELFSHSITSRERMVMLFRVIESQRGKAFDYPEAPG